MTTKIWELIAMEHFTQLQKYFGWSWTKLSRSHCWSNKTDLDTTLDLTFFSTKTSQTSGGWILRKIQAEWMEWSLAEPACLWDSRFLRNKLELGFLVLSWYWSFFPGDIIVLACTCQHLSKSNVQKIIESVFEFL